MADLYAVDLYQGRIENKSHDVLWVPWERRKDQLVQTVRALWPYSTGCKIIDRIDASSNEVILFDIKFPSSEGTAAHWEKLAIRLPRQGSESSKLTDEEREKYDKDELPLEEIPTVVLGRGIFYSVAIHQHVVKVTSTTGIPVPKLIAYDCTKDNLFRNEYILMERIPGQSLEDVLDDLPAEKRLKIAKELGEIVNSLRRVTSRDAGYIQASKSQKWRAYVYPSHTLPHIHTDIIPFGIDSDHLSASDQIAKDSHLSVREVLKGAWTRRLDKHIQDHPQDKATGVEFRNLWDMAQRRIDGGKVLDTGEFCLWHGDLFPRNIMVDVEASPMITGIIDWDEAVYAPILITAVAPFWLWLPRDVDDEAGRDGGVDGFSVDKESENDEACNNEEDNENASSKEQQDEITKVDDDQDSIYMDEDETVARSNEIPEDPELRSVRDAFAATVGNTIWASSIRSDDINLRWLFTLVARDYWPYWWHDISSAMVKSWKASLRRDGKELDEHGSDNQGSDEEGSRSEEDSDENNTDEEGRSDDEDDSDEIGSSTTLST